MTCRRSWGWLWRGAFAAALLCGCVQPALADILSFLDSGQATVTGPHELELTPDGDGIYYVFAQVNGAQVRFVVDTGSDDIVLARRDAMRAGIDVTKLSYSEDTDTAAGPSLEADATVHSLAIGPMRFANLPVSVNASSMESSLLGMDFLMHLKSVEFTKGHLYLRW